MQINENDVISPIGSSKIMSMNKLSEFSKTNEHQPKVKSKIVNSIIVEGISNELNKSPISPDLLNSSCNSEDGA